MVPAPISLAITPKTPADRRKLASALKVLAAEDAHLEVRPGDEPDCTVVGAVAEKHLEEIIDRLRREFEVEAGVGRPTVTYLETLMLPAEGSARHMKMVDDHGEYAHVSLRLHPGGAGEGYSFSDTTIGGAIPKRFMASIDEGIRESIATGVLRGHPIVDLRVEVHGCSYHDTDSTDAAFKTAAAMAFHEAATKAQPLVLEPVMQVVVTASNRHVNAVLEGLLIRKE